MSTFLVFIRKLLGCCGLCLEEEELRVRLKDGCANAAAITSSSQLLGSTKNGCILAETSSQKTQLVPQKVTSASQLSSVLSSYDAGCQHDGPDNDKCNGASTNEADVYSSNMSIKEVTSEDSFSACSQHNSLESPSGTNYDGDDSFKEKLTRPKTTVEPDSNPAKSNKRVSKRERKKAMQLSSLLNHNEKPTGELKASSSSDHQVPSSTTPHRINANAVIVPSGEQLRICENGCALSETDYSPSLLDKKELFSEKINYEEADNDSSKGKPICPLNSNTKADSRPLKNQKQSPHREKRKAMRLLLRNIQSEQLNGESSKSYQQLNGESSKSYHSSLPSSNSIEQDWNNADDLIVPSSQVTSENGHLFVEPNSMSTVPDLKPTVTTSCTDLMLTIQSDKMVPSWKPSFLVNKGTDVALDKATISGYLQSEKQESLCFKNSLEEHKGTHDSLGSDSFTYYDAEDPLKEKLSGPQKIISESVSIPLETKKKARRRKCKALEVSLSKNQNEQLTGESPIGSHYELLRANYIEPVSNNGNDTSASSSQGSGENGDMLAQFDSSPKLISQNVTSAINIKAKDVKMQVAKEKSICTNHLMPIHQSTGLLSSSKKPCSVDGSSSTTALLDKTTVLGYLQSEEQKSLCIDNSVEEKNRSHGSLGSDCFIHEDADSPKDVPTCPQNPITEPNPVSKKKASKRKGTKICILNNQKEHLIVEASTSDLQSLNAFEQISNADITIRVSYSQLLGSTENGCILAELDSFLNELGSKKNYKKEVKQWVAKEECSPKMSSLVNGSANAAGKKLTGHVQSEFSFAADEQESGDIQRPLKGNNSPKTQPVPNKITSAIVIKQKEVQLWVPKEKSSSSDHPISTQQLQNLVSTSNKHILVTGSTNDTLKKTTLVEFSADPGERESPKFDSSLKGSNGSHKREILVTSPTNSVVVVEREIQGYCSSHKILLVGEGNFSFSMCLARAFISATNMVATSLNSEAYLEHHYMEAMKNISELRMRGCKVLHEVDATTLADHSSINGHSFDRIIYNFPHCGSFTNSETDLRSNQKLVRLFMENSSKLIKRDGEIHIRHKSNQFFSQWDVKGLASEAGLVLIHEARFNLRRFKGYNTKYGFNKGRFLSDHNFSCHPSRTYKFVLPCHQKILRRKNSKLNA